MITLDLTNLENSDLKYQISNFPDGQQSITITHVPFLEKNEVTIKSRLNSFKDLEVIICANQALKELNIKDVELYTPYFLGARSDRKFLDGQSNYLKTVICPIINSQNFSRVTVIDPHSDVIEACLNNFHKITNVNFTKESIDSIIGDVTLISPDAGAIKKVYDVAVECSITDIIVANKVRDIKNNGKIVRTEVPGIDTTPVSKNFVICDDICDGGRTFLEIAKTIRNIRSKSMFNDKIYLCVTHGIFSAGFEELEKYLDGIFTTNSVKEIENELVKQVNIF